MLISEILEKAADRCAAGWAQGHINAGRDGCHCAQTAIEVTRCEAVMGYEAEEAFAAQLGWRGEEDSNSSMGFIWAWNDAPERTQAEVVAKLREAAAKARDQGK